MMEPAHNSYATVASETGFPGFFLFIGGIAASFLTFQRIKRKFQGDVRAKDLVQAAVCMQLMMVMFCLAVGFLNFAFSSHFPTMVGMSIAMAYATEDWQAAHLLQDRRTVLKKEGDGGEKSNTPYGHLRGDLAKGWSGRLRRKKTKRISIRKPHN